MFHKLFNKKYLNDKQLPCSLRKEENHGAFKIHVHEFMELVIVYEGSAEQLIFDERRRIEAGSVFLIHSMMPHGYAHCNHLCLYNLLFDLRTQNNPLLAFSHDPTTATLFQLEPTPDKRDVLKLSPEELEEVLKLLRAMEEEQTRGESHFALAMAGYFVLLIVTLARYYNGRNLPLNKKPSLILSELLNQLAEHPEKHWTRPEMANFISVSERTLTRMFKHCTGFAPNEYLISLRVKKSAMLLLNTEDSLDSIAEQTGFVNGNYFCRQFKQHMGITPQKYRAKREA